MWPRVLKCAKTYPVPSKRSLHQKNILENSLRFNFLGLQHFYVPHFFDHKGALGEWFITDRNVFAKEVCWFFPISSVDEQ